jgi:hypothetical protein
MNNEILSVKHWSEYFEEEEDADEFMDLEVQSYVQGMQERQENGDQPATDDKITVESETLAVKTKRKSKKPTSGTTTPKKDTVGGENAFGTAMIEQLTIAKTPKSTKKNAAKPSIFDPLKLRTVEKKQASASFMTAPKPSPGRNTGVPSHPSTGQADSRGKEVGAPLATDGEVAFGSRLFNAPSLPTSNRAASEKRILAWTSRAKRLKDALVGMDATARHKNINQLTEIFIEIGMLAILMIFCR